MSTPKEFMAHNFKITIIEKPAFEVTGFTAFVKLDGVSIGLFLEELIKSGKMEKLVSTLKVPQQIWVCLSGNEGNSEADCRCTICVERTLAHDFSSFLDEELFTLHVPASSWAVFEVNAKQSPTQLHRIGVYNVIREIGYAFNDEVGLHFDNEHEWEPGKRMNFLLPVKIDAL